MRKLVENLVCYWGLDNDGPSLADFLDSFDNRIRSAISGMLIVGDTYRRQSDTIYGLHRYGEELVAAQGSDAMSKILDMGDLMKEIAKYWEYEPYAVVDDLAARLSAEVRTMLESIPLPGQPAIGENAGYEIKQAILDLLSHGNYSLFDPKEMVEENKEHFKRILNNFLDDY